VNTSVKHVKALFYELMKTEIDIEDLAIYYNDLHLDREELSLKEHGIVSDGSITLGERNCPKAEWQHFCSGLNLEGKCLNLS
jgi:hypothetical protein